METGRKKIAVLLIESNTNIDFDLGEWKGAIFRCVADQGKWLTFVDIIFDLSLS